MELKLRQGTWVVVCDGRKTIVLENIGDEDYPDLRTRSALEAEDAPTSALGTDRPGRVHQSVGEARSGVEQTDWHDRDEQEFLKALAARLDKAVLAKEVDPPRHRRPAAGLGRAPQGLQPARQGGDPHRDRQGPHRRTGFGHRDSTCSGRAAVEGGC